MQEEPMLSTAERIVETEALIARLEGELAASRAVEEQSRALRAEHALAAAEGSASAQKALAEASHAAAMAVLDSENLELALAAARDRLAGFQAQAAQERLAVVRARALELARERQTLGHQLQQALTDLNTVFVAWHGAGRELAGLRYENPTLYLPHNCDQARPFLAAVPDELRQTFHQLDSWVHPVDRRRIAEADPAAAILRSAGELAPLPPEPPSLAEQVLDELNAEAARPRATGNPHIALETGRSLMSDGVIPQHAAQDAMLAGFRVVGRTASGGAITERVRGSHPPEAA
jgi:hypothetical protein